MGPRTEVEGLPICISVDLQSTEVMHSVALIALLSFVAQARAEEVATTDMNDSQNSMDKISDELMEKLASKLIDRVGASFTQNGDLDTATLGKPGHLGLPLESNLPVQTSFGSEQENDREPMLVVLNLEGGAAKKPMAAMAAMAAPMKSVGKAKKPMNEYMTKLAAARKSGAKSFDYKGKTYVAGKTKTGMVVYKAK